MPSIQQLEKELAWAKKQTSFAWAKFYEAENNQHPENMVQFKKIEVFTEVEDIPLHVVAELKSMMKQLKKKIECPICLEVINPNQLEITRCGHKFCRTCLGTLKTTTKKCAICRKTICK